jgi:transposase
MCQGAVARTRIEEPPAMSISMIGIDTAKSTFHLHGVDAQGKVQLKRKLRRDELIAFF